MSTDGAGPTPRHPTPRASAAFHLAGLDLTRLPAACERGAMKLRSRALALWVLGGRRRASATADPVEIERRKAYAAMGPGERLARALAFSSFAFRLRGSARLSRHP